MRPETIDLMCNPYKGEPFIREGKTLRGVSSKQTFPIRDGIPIVLAEESLTGLNRQSKMIHDFFAFSYDFIVNLGDRIRLNSEHKVRQEYIAKLPIQEEERVLETAAGTASNLFYLPKNIDYFGLDISFPMLKRAQRKARQAGREAELIQADCAYIPFRDEAFHHVFQMGALQFFEDPFKAVSEMARVASQGTTIHILDEVGGAIRTLERLPAHKKYANDAATAVEGIKRLVPPSMEEIGSEVIPGTDFYALRFTKPSLASA